jgi:hypothetical protein
VTKDLYTVLLQETSGSTVKRLCCVLGEVRSRMSARLDGLRNRGLAREDCGRWFAVSEHCASHFVAGYGGRRDCGRYEACLFGYTGRKADLPTMCPTDCAWFEEPDHEALLLAAVSKKCGHPLQQIQVGYFPTRTIRSGRSDK